MGHRDGPAARALFCHPEAIVSEDGRQYLAVWIRAHVTNSVMLANFDIVGTRVRFGEGRDWEKPEGHALPLAASPVSEAAPALAAGPPGHLLLVYETFPADGRVLVACRPLRTE